MRQMRAKAGLSLRGAALFFALFFLLNAGSLFAATDLVLGRSLVVAMGKKLVMDPLSQRYMFRITYHNMPLTLYLVPGIPTAVVQGVSPEEQPGQMLSAEEVGGLPERTIQLKQAPSYLGGLLVIPAEVAPYFNEYRSVIDSADDTMVRPIKQIVIDAPSTSILNNDFVVVIDPGHGGKDPGAVQGGVKEKEVNLAIATKLATILKARNIKPVMTRDTDVFIELSDRARVGCREGDLFISIHADSAASASARGIAVIYQNPDYGWKNLNLNDIPADQLNLAANANAAQKQAAYGRLKGGHLELSAAFARALQNRFSGNFPIRRIYRDERNLAVLRENFPPACLIETGFLSNPEERAKLTTSWHQQKIAELIADSIEEFARQSH